MAAEARSAARIAFTTWNALFLRTSVARLSASRFAWFWILLEPIAFIVLLMVVFSVLRVRHIGGIGTAVWIMAGVLSFLMFRRTAAETMTALRHSKPLFTFSQIAPIDPSLVNAAVEGLLMVIVSVILVAGAALVQLDVIPSDPLGVLEALAALWLLGVGYGLVTSVALELLPPVGAVLSFTLRPLYFLSGVVFPVLILPYPYRDWFLFNPIVHGVESARVGFAPYYHVPPEVNLPYLYGWALGTVFLGLALYVRHGRRLARPR